MKGQGSGHAHSNSSHKSSSPTPRGSIFANFETVQLSTEERLYLHAARLGDHLLLKEVLDKEGTCILNPNCVDYMGRNALHLAVDSESVDMIEILMEKLHVECMEDALLHAISSGSLNIVRIIVDHPRYIADGGQSRLTKYRGDAFYRTEEKYQYPPDMTPLMLAAHKNDHEMVQMFLARGCLIERPHAIYCQCQDCSVKQQCDSLKRSRSRLNAYKALSSPAYMALSSPDPITATFELRQEMMQVAAVEKEFQSDYIGLAEQCMNFACEMMDLCRGTQEVEAVLGEESTESRDPLARLNLAIRYNEKRFVAHPNCQQHLTSIWYGNEMGFLQSASVYKKAVVVLIWIPLLPFLCLTYIVNPYLKISAAMKCPVSKFIMHTISHFVFLILLSVATFGLEEVFYISSEGSGKYPSTNSDCSPAQKKEMLTILRPARSGILTEVQILIIFWIIGLIWIECKQVYSSGAREHFLQYYNFMDFSLLALYLASYSLKFVAQYRVSQANVILKATARIDEEYNNNGSCDLKHIEKILSDIKQSEDGSEYGYFLQASRFHWAPEDPEIISDILFAIANILSFARTTYIMPSHELLGPLQISLGRMIGDIARFVVLFLLVLVAFMVGMTNLYRYYGSLIVDKSTNTTASQSFKGLPETVHTLFFSIFGLIALDKLKINGTGVDGGYNGDNSSSQVVDRTGMILFAIYQVAVTIVLVNMLIAMMSHSFEAIQGDNDVEWKFARTQLWVNYIDEGSTLPVPFNMIPSLKSFKYLITFFKELVKRDDESIKYDFSRRRGPVLPTDLDPITANLLGQKRATYSDIIQRLVRRYLFKLDREKREKEKVETVARAEDYEEEQEDSRQEPCDVMRDVSISSELVAISEDEVIDVIKPVDARHSMLGASPPPTSPDAFGQSSSAEALRQFTRRATMKRGSNKRQSCGPKVYSNTQLDAIQRGQRMLDARLQDLQSINRNEEVVMKDNLKHVRHLLTESQKALGSLVSAMTSMQEDVVGMNRVMVSIHKTVHTEKPRSHGKLTQAHSEPKEHKSKEKAAHTRSDECTAQASGSGSQPGTSAQPKDKRAKKWHSIKKSLKRKRGSGGDGPAPV